MAKIRLIEDKTYRRFMSLVKDQESTPNELLTQFMDGVVERQVMVEGEDISVIEDDYVKKMEADYQEQLKQIVELEMKQKADSENWESIFEQHKGQAIKDSKTLTKKTEMIAKRDTDLKELRTKLSSVKKDNKKLSKQIKALTVVEEDGDS